MPKPPKIQPPAEMSDFHDSSLIWFAYDPAHERAEAVLSTPDQFEVEHLWQILMHGVLALELETLGSGEPRARVTPPEVYDVYDDLDATVAHRWRERLKVLGLAKAEIHNVVFASSYLRGWGENEGLEGFRVVCRHIEIVSAPPDFSGRQFARPRIPAGERRGKPQGR